ncbi:MAG: hypothetical protein IPL33_17570 [Sphingobacteriales bacterium]|nr:hypothetical protein [Sphingobacteriales bacterium]
MKKLFFCVAMLLFGYKLMGQSTFTMTIDVDTSSNDSNNATAIVANEQGIWIASLDFCDNGTCTDYIKPI